MEGNAQTPGTRKSLDHMCVHAQMRANTHTYYVLSALILGAVIKILQYIANFNNHKMWNHKLLSLLRIYLQFSSGIELSQAFHSLLSVHHRSDC